jgi:YHS domain-containing protein
MPSVTPVVEPEVVDPVCGMSILRSDAVGQVTHRGHTYYFCSEGCIDKFRASPDTYLNPASSRLPSDAREYMCPMDPEVRRSVPVHVPSVEWRSSLCRRRP